MVRDIKNREDIFLLVNTFYQNVRTNELLGPIFNNSIKENQWPDHLDRLTDFWVTNLFGEVSYKGNPTKTHIEMDKANEYSISQVHFGTWLNLWFQTIDVLFSGKLANKAKEGARGMASRQFMTMFKHKPK